MDELRRTNPDFVVYVPKGEGSGAHDGTNHVVTVMPGLVKNRLLAFWLQDTAEQAPDSHYVFASSDDGGVSWTEPVSIAGEGYDPVTGKNRCCFGTAFRNAKGRVYVMINCSSGYSDPHENGFLFIRYTDDDGRTFSPLVQVEFEKHKDYDNDDPAVPPTWIPFQPPIKISTGKYVGGISRYASYTKFPKRPQWIDEESVCHMYVLENADDNPEPRDLKFTWTTALRAPSRVDASWSVAQEVSIVELPDHRLFCAFRTNSGSPWYSVSEDGGYHWRDSEVLRFGDGLPAMQHPLSPCPLFTDGKGNFFIFIHNHDGHFGPWLPVNGGENRRPVFLVRGTFDPNAHQPLKFSPPEFFFDDNGVHLGYNVKRADLALYGSMTNIDGQCVLWYPDRKHFICGKIIPKEP